jgi:hypothetical protein
LPSSPCPYTTPLSHLWQLLKAEPPVVIQVLERQHAKVRRQPRRQVAGEQGAGDGRQRVVPVGSAPAGACGGRGSARRATGAVR